MFWSICSIDPCWRISFKAVCPPIPEHRLRMISHTNYIAQHLSGSCNIKVKHSKIKSQNTSNAITIITSRKNAQVNELIHGKIQLLQNLTHIPSEQQTQNQQTTSVCNAQSTFATSNSMTGTFLELGSIKCRRNLGAPKVKESMSSEATA